MCVCARSSGVWRRWLLWGRRLGCVVILVAGRYLLVPVPSASPLFQPPCGVVPVPWTGVVHNGTVCEGGLPNGADTAHGVQFFDIYSFVATFRVARLSSQTRKLWCRDRPSRALPLTCPNVKILLKNKTKKTKKNQKSTKSTFFQKKKKLKKKEEPPRVPSETAYHFLIQKEMLQDIVQQLRPQKIGF